MAVPVHIRVTHDPSINYAFQQNGIPVLREIRVRHEGAEELRDVTVHVTTEPPFALPLELRVQALAPGVEFRAGPIDQKLSPTLLGALRERTTGLLHVEVRTGETVLGRHSSAIALLAHNEWSGLDSLPDILAAFVLPNDPALAPVLTAAADLLRTQDAVTQLNGYQDRSRRRVWDQLSAIHRTLAAAGVRYVNPPASFEQTGQKIRFPGDVLAHRTGTCLDLALLFAACCEQAGLHPLILLQKGHAYAGCWLVERTLPDAAIDDLQTIRKLVDLEELAVFETSAFAADESTTLEQAEQLARRHLAPGTPMRLALDIRRARANRVLPLALPGATPIPARPADAPAKPASSYTPGTSRRFQDDDAPVSELAATPRGTEAGAAATRIDQWKSRLLDLSLRNRLLNFRPTLGTVQILCPNPERVEDALSTTTEVHLRPRPTVMQARDPRDPALHLALHGEDAVLEHLTAELALGRLHTPLTAPEHQKRLTEIFRSARASLEENGANTLFVAVGFLEWRETAHSDRRQRAPLLLVPVELKRKSMLEGFTLRRLDEETRLNVTLVEMLRQHFRKEIPGLDPLPEDETGVNVALVMRRFKEAVRDLAGWEVRPEVWLGQFSFAKFLLWKDLADRLDALTRNRVVRHLVHRAGSSYHNPGDDIRPQDVDGLARPDRLFCPRSADSSQLAAVLAAADGQDFVLEGPPGTGKSQTITNIIAHCLAHGKRVLFVAEKRAALDVVHRRLKEEGLEPFCLELHSHHAGKSEVLAQFRKSLEFAAEEAPEAWTRRVAELTAVRDELNTYVHALHRPHPCGLSVYACFNHLIDRRGAARPLLSLERMPVLSLDEAELDARRAAISALTERATPLGAVHEHPLAPLRCTEWSGAWESRARQERAALAATLGPLEEAFAALHGRLGTTAGLRSRRELAALARVSMILLQAPPAGAGLLTAGPEPLLRDLDRWQKLANERAELRRHVAAFDEARLLALDLPALGHTWFAAEAAWVIPRFLAQRRVRAALATALTDRALPENSAIAPLLTHAARLRDIQAEFAGAMAEGGSRLGLHWRGGEPEPETLASARVWAADVHAALDELLPGDPVGRAALCERLGAELASGDRPFAPTAETGAMLASFLDRWKAFEGALDALAATLAVDRTAIDTAPDHLQAIAALLQTLDTGWRDLRYWCAWQRARREAGPLGVQPFLAALEQDGVPPAELPALFEASFRQTLLTQALDAEPVLREFFGHDHEARIRRFRDLDRQVATLTRDIIRARLAANLPDDRGDEAAPSAELGLLRKELAKRARHMPVRQLLSRIPGLLPRLKPCVLMSPLSVAQYLEPTHEHFDLVVFDEASQIPVWDAVGAIARGRQLVVVGDPKQLPPTSFFNRSDHPEEGEDELLASPEDLESILDELLSHGLRHKRLTWHYRSLHESLITFSNRSYYDNALLTFPSPAGGRGGIHFHRVSGASYDKGESRTNRAEAEALVADLVRRLTDSIQGKLSYGIVTFSQAQQDLVENLIDERRRENPALEIHFGDETPVEGEPVFVKNLENVQGDERDVILFSICYGPDASGAISMNFGPLNRDGGERRLNVAITRARREIRVFSTLVGDDIDLTRSRARGVRDLKLFLDYAERGQSALPFVDTTDAPPPVPTAFEKLVAERLRAAGYAVDHHVGCSGCRVDLAIGDPSSPGHYILGIECDGDGYRRAATARDRDILRDSVLERLGWRLHRVWAPDWWHDTERETQRLLAAAAAAVASRPASATPPTA